MTRLSEQHFVCLDCETTGLESKEDAIIEVAAVSFCNGAILDRYETLVDPGRAIPESSTLIHHITDEMVIGKPSIKDILSEFFTFIGKSIIVGHSINFDITILRESARREGLAFPLDQNTVIDTLRLARLYGESPANSLAHLCAHFNIPHEDAHRAMGDVLVTVELFGHLSQKFSTTEKLLDRLSRPIAMRAMPFGKHKGRPFREIPLNYLEWAATKQFDQDLLFSIRSELKRRKKGSNFSQAASPFADL